MKARRGDRGIQGHAQVQVANDRQHSLRDDPGPAGGTDGQKRAIAPEHDRRTHAGQGTFARCNGIGLAANQAKGVGSWE